MNEARERTDELQPGRVGAAGRTWPAHNERREPLRPRESAGGDEKKKLEFN